MTAQDPAELAERLRRRARYHDRARYDAETFRGSQHCSRDYFNEAAALIEQLVAERDGWEKAANEGMEPRLKRFTFEDGEFSAELTGEAVNALALSFVSHFKEMGAENYFELNLHDRADPFQHYTVTVQKVGGLSPGQKATAAEERATAAECGLTAANERVTAAVEALEPFAREGAKLTPDEDRYSWRNTGLSNADFRRADAARARLTGGR